MGIGGIMETIIQNIILGVYSDWFFQEFLAKVWTALMSNFALLWLIAISFQKFSKKTKNTWDNYLADKFVNFLEKFKGKGVTKGDTKGDTK